MKKLSEKFDHFPHDFDREAIWMGVEKPVRKPNLLICFRIILPIVLIVALVIAFGERFVTKTELPAMPEKTKSIPEKTFAYSNAPDQIPDLTALMEDKFILPQTTNNSATTAGNAGKIALPKELDEIKTIPQETTLTKGFPAKNQNQIPVPKSTPDAKAINNVETLPYLLLAPKSNQEKTISIPSKKILAQQKGSRQSLAIRTGIGLHHSDFSSASEEATRWRSNLEKPLLDYSIGIRYEYRLWQNFLLSMSAGYQLYKDKITASHLGEQAGKNVQIDYRLYNHYHVFSSQLELGRRFFQKRFFWDINGGVGLKFHQISEVDYFIGAEELAGDELVQAAYQSSTDVFFTAQAAIGKHFAHRFFVRSGVQINAAIDLTAPQAATRHRMVPVQAFFEVGMRF